MTRKARVGSISTGTLLTADLVDAFANELAYLDAQAHAETIAKASAWLELDEEERDDEEGGWILEALTDDLDALAPPYCYFGTLEGDGADFGFWPSWSSIEELPHITDDADAKDFADQARELGEDCKFVNDHGNVTVYGADGSVLLELV
jgi:hypothetical protein